MKELKEFLLNNYVSLFMGVCEETGVFNEVNHQYFDKAALRQVAYEHFEHRFENDDEIDVTAEEIELILEKANQVSAQQAFITYSEDGYLNVFVNDKGEMGFVYNEKGEQRLN
jgi:hypothetical protein